MKSCGSAARSPSPSSADGECFSKAVTGSGKAATDPKNGQEVSLTIESFEQIDMDQVPGYKVRSTYEVDGEKVEQLTYLLLGDKTYTITYSQMADDELMADFEISEGEIKLVKGDKI